MRFVIRTALLTTLAVCATALMAQPISYGRIPVQIRCGVVLLSSTSGPGGQPTNADPYVFYNLDRRQDIKPPGWTFVNPLASSTWSPTQAARWNAILGSAQFTAGDKLGKNMAAYWEVDLSQISNTAITNYDILMIHAPGAINLNPTEREKLQIFIDSGGTLWFDKSTTQIVDPYNNFPVPFVTTNAGGNPQVLQPFHPILNYPFQLGYFEAAYMGAHRGGHAVQAATILPLLQQVAQPATADFQRFNIISSNNAGMTLGIANMGAGHFVVTSTNIVSLINEPTGGTNVGLGRNSGAIGGTNFQNIPLTELKFVYNLIALSGSHPALSKGSRRLNSSFDDVGAPLLSQWSDTALNLDQGDVTNYFPPAIYKGVVYVTAGTRLYAYKADTSRDLDEDGWNDDGLQDLSIGAKYDLIWRSTDMPGPLSSPVCVEVAQPGPGIPRDQVYVLDGQGNLRVFDALPRNAQGRLLGPNLIAPGATLAPPPGTAPLDLSVNNRGPYTPVHFEGVVYVYDGALNGLQTNGRVWAVDTSTVSMVTSSNPWVARGVGSPNLYEPGGSPTVGYIPITDNPNGVDSVMYVPNRSTLTGQAAGVTSLWIGAKGESPPQVNRGALSFDVITRAASKGLRVYDGGGSLGFHIYLVDTVTGQPLNEVTTATYLRGTYTQFAPGQIRFDTFQPLPNNIGVRIDYHIDWGTGAPNLLSQLIRGQLFLPDDINRQRYSVKSMALAGNGNLFIVTSNELSGGTLFCVNETQRGQFRLVYRWDLYDQINITINGTQTVRWGPALIDQDYLVTNLVPFLNVPMRRLHFHGSPTVINNVCYVSASGEKNFGTRVTIIMAFDANPTRTDVRLGGPVPSGFRMRQVDVAASTNKNTPERSVSLQAGQYDQETDAGVIRFNNLMSGTAGDMRNAFSTSLPVIVAGNGQPETVLDPDATGSKWSPLLWYFVYNGFENDSPPLVMGNTIYEAGGGLLYDLIVGNDPPVARPSLFAMDADIPPNDPSILRINGRPGLKQARWLYPSANFPGFTSSPHVRWPSGQGVMSLNDFAIRLSQTLLDNSAGNIALGVVGGDGVVAAWARNGIHGFKRAATVVADEGRVIEMDSAGFVLWSSDLTYQWANDGNNTIIQTQKLVRPTKVYKLSENEYVVVDTGGDRVMRMDRGAGEVRSIESVSLDPIFRPSGWNEGDEPRLRQPRDVAVWGDYVPAANNRFTDPPGSQLEYWVHYLIADSGNRRLVELVDRFVADPTTFSVGNVVRNGAGQAQLGKLVWHTPQNFSGKTWQFTGIQRFQIGIDPNTNNAQFIYVASVGDMLPSRVDVGLDPPSGTGTRETGGGSGGIVVFDAVNGNDVINQVVLPNGLIKPLTGVNSVSVRGLGLVGGFVNYAIMFTDTTGVYEIARNGNQWNVIWMMSNGVYEQVRYVKLRATSAKRMPNGEVLITNAFFGSTNPPVGPQLPFYGEVTQWKDTYNFADPQGLLGFRPTSVRFELPPVVGSRGLRNPQFADRL